MKTEYAIQTQHQNNVEQDALFPTSQEPELTTDDVIIRGEDSAEHPFKSFDIESFDPEERFERTVASLRYEYDKVLDFNVKNDLVAQLFDDSIVTSGAFDTKRVARLIEKQMRVEKDRHATAVDYITDSAIPTAERRLELVAEELATGTHTPQELSKLQKRVTNLENDVTNFDLRMNAHQRLADHIKAQYASLVIGEDGFIGAAEAAIVSLGDSAKSEVEAIYAERAAEQERKAARVRAVGVDTTEVEPVIVEAELPVHITQVPVESLAPADVKVLKRFRRIVRKVGGATMDMLGASFHSGEIETVSPAVIKKVDSAE